MADQTNYIAYGPANTGCDSKCESRNGTEPANGS